MTEEQIQNKKKSLVCEIIGGIIPAAYALFLAYQMIESFFEK